MGGYRSNRSDRFHHSTGEFYQRPLPSSQGSYPAPPNSHVIPISEGSLLLSSAEESFNIEDLPPPPEEWLRDDPLDNAQSSGEYYPPRESAPPGFAPPVFDTFPSALNSALPRSIAQQSGPALSTGPYVADTSSPIRYASGSPSAPSTCR